MTGSFISSAEDLIKMANYLEELETNILNHYLNVEDFLKMLVEMGWQDNINAQFTKVAESLMAEMIPLKEAIHVFSEIKHKEAGLEISIKDLIVPQFNI